MIFFSTNLKGLLNYCFYTIYHKFNNVLLAEILNFFCHSDGLLYNYSVISSL